MSKMAKKQIKFHHPETTIDIMVYILPEIFHTNGIIICINLYRINFISLHLFSFKFYLLKNLY